MNRLILIASVLVIFSSSLIAHQANEFKQTGLVAKAALVARAGDFPESPEVKLPGFMLGGDAFSSESGIRFDDIQLLATKNVNERYFVSAKLAGHQHGSSSELSIENLWFGAHFWQQKLLVEAGKMATEVTPTANYHAAQDVFTEAPLLADVFFGRHHQDTGLRVRLNLSSFELGAEFWDGQRWPVSGQTDGAMTLFAKTKVAIGQHSFAAQLWALDSKVIDRSDPRLNSDHHSSSGDVTIGTVQQLQFSGEVTLLGANLFYQYQTNTWDMRSEFEWIGAKQQGEIFDGNQFGHIDSETQGLRFKQSFTRASHQVNLQYEYLVANNVFTDTPSLMVQTLGLVNHDFEPKRAQINWRWQFDQDFTLITEYNKETLMPDQTQQRLAIGLIWQWRII